VVNDYTLIVRTPGRWDGFRVFTDAQRAEAEAYAAGMGVAVETLPFPYPD